MNDQTKTRADYFRLMNMNGASHVYREAIRHGVLDAIAKQPKSASDIAASCGTLEEPTNLLLEVLGTLGLVQHRDRVFTLTPLAAMLISGGYREIGDPYWGHLPSYLKTGKPITAMDSVTQSETHYQKQAAALGWMLAPAAGAAAIHLRSDGNNNNLNILDIGAGSAIWSLTLASHDDTSTVTAVDWPAVLPIAVNTAQQLGIENQLSTSPGNYHEVDLGADTYDLTIMGNVTHLETPASNQSLFKKVYAALKNKGRIVILDIFPGDPQGDINRTLYALGLALRTEQGHVYTPEALVALLKAEGFIQTSLTNLQVPPHTVGMLVAHKK